MSSRIKDDWLIYEKKYMAQGYNLICGVDEAGRGPLAGPVYAAAVILPDNLIISGVNDSKKVTPKKRNELFDIIKEKALSYSIASASACEIDELNILKATHLAMQRAVETLDASPDFVLVDGNSLPEFKIPAITIIKGDALSESIACASILAKVSRDRYMEEFGEKYPEYNFKKHKGYGTKLHIDAIYENDLIDGVHRKTFCRRVKTKNFQLAL